MNGQKLRGAIGLAMKSGNCAAGDFAAAKAIKSGAAKLALIDDRASENARKRFFDMCVFRGVECLVVQGVAEAIGRSGVVVAAITDEGFARMIAAAYAAEGLGTRD